MEKVIDITAKRDGFRRAGKVHSETTTTYPLSDFTKAQLEQLKNEPMLVVAIRNATEQQAGPAEDSPLVLDLRKQITTLTDQLATSGSDLTAANARVTELTAQLDGLADVARTKDLTASLTADLEASTGLLTTERQKVSELTTELEGERQKVTDLTAQLEASTKKGK